MERNKKEMKGAMKSIHVIRGDLHSICIFILNIRSVSSAIGCKRDKSETGRGGQF